MGYLHYLNIVHLDIKPENLCVDHHLNITLVDVGLAKELSSGQEFLESDGICGTIPFMAIEMFQGE